MWMWLRGSMSPSFGVARDGDLLVAKGGRGRPVGPDVGARVGSLGGLRFGAGFGPWSGLQVRAHLGSLLLPDFGTDFGSGVDSHLGSDLRTLLRPLLNGLEVLRGGHRKQLGQHRHLLSDGT